MRVTAFRRAVVTIYRLNWSRRQEAEGRLSVRKYKDLLLWQLSLKLELHQQIIVNYQ